MEVVLLERIEKLGQMGDVVQVKDGYARNFLLPRGKALRANKDNLSRFEADRAQLEARNLELKKEVGNLATSMTKYQSSLGRIDVKKLGQKASRLAAIMEPMTLQDA